MRLRLIGVDRRYLLPLQLAFFAVVAASAFAWIGDPIHLIPPVIVESLGLALILRTGRWHALVSEVLVFSLALDVIIFDFSHTFAVESPAGITVASFVIILLLVEAAVLSYMVFGERAIRRILLGLSSSTTLVVFLIVLFVMKEGFPAFTENDPFEFITGTDWQPFYDDGATCNVSVETTVLSYGYVAELGDDVVYASPGFVASTCIHLINFGGAPDTYTVSESSDSGMELTIETASITLDGNSEGEIILSLYALAFGTYHALISIDSLLGGAHQDLRLTLECRSVGVDISPDILDFRAYGREATILSAPVKITNSGDANDTILISVSSPSVFHPSFLDIEWNYSSSSGSLSLAPHESQTLTFVPRIVSYVDGDYTMNVVAVSATDGSVSDQLSVRFLFSQEDSIQTDRSSASVAANGSVSYSIDISQITADEFGIAVHPSDSGWSCVLFYGDSMLIESSGFYNWTVQDDGPPSVLTLVVSPSGADTGDIVRIVFTVVFPGTQPSLEILPFIVGTAVMTGFAVAIAAPLGIGCAVFLAEYCPRRIHHILRPSFELLAGIPSVLYGMWGFLTFAPIIEEHVYPAVERTLGGVLPFISSEEPQGECILTASIVLGLMILPIIITLSEDSIRAVPRDIREASFGVGASKWQTVRRMLLPAAKSGITTSVILATGRAIGETMAVLMIMGAVSEIPGSVFEPIGTMTSVIASAFGWSYTSPLTRHALFAIGTILFFMVFALNVVIFRLQSSGKRREVACLSNPRSAEAKTGMSILGRLRQHVRAMTIATGNRLKLRSMSAPAASETAGSIRTAFTSTRKITAVDTFARVGLLLSVILVIGLLFAIVTDLVVKGIPSMSPEFVYERETSGGLGGGFANAIVGSLLLISLAIGVAGPLAIGSAIYVTEYASAENRLTRVILFTSDTLASTPSIVFGAFGFMFFVLYLEFGFSLLAGGLTLAVMVIPLILRSTVEAIRSVPDEYREAALALGISKWKTIRHVVLPSSSPLVLSGVIISIGRSIGETAAVMLTAGYSALIVHSLFQPAASMPNMIFLYYNLTIKWPIVGEKVYSAAFILITVVLLLNLSARIVMRKFGDKAVG